MKKLIISLFLILPLFVFGQNSVNLKNLNVKYISITMYVTSLSSGGSYRGIEVTMNIGSEYNYWVKPVINKHGKIHGTKFYNQITVLNYFAKYGYYLYSRWMPSPLPASAVVSYLLVKRKKLVNDSISFEKRK